PRTEPRRRRPGHLGDLGRVDAALRSLLRDEHHPHRATVERLIHHKTRTLAAITPGPDFTTESWLEALYLALTFRSDERVPCLAQTPVTSRNTNEERHGVEGDGHLHSSPRRLQVLVLRRRPPEHT